MAMCSEGEATHQWDIIDTKGNGKLIKNKGTGRCLSSDQGGSSQNHHPHLATNCDRFDAPQEFKFKGGDLHLIKNRHGNCLKTDLKGKPEVYKCQNYKTDHASWDDKLAVSSR
jgi:hypothetical protein